MYVSRVACVFPLQRQKSRLFTSKSTRYVVTGDGIDSLDLNALAHQDHNSPLLLFFDSSNASSPCLSFFHSTTFISGSISFTLSLVWRVSNVTHEWEKSLRSFQSNFFSSFFFFFFFSSSTSISKNDERRTQRKKAMVAVPPQKNSPTEETKKEETIWFYKSGGLGQGLQNFRHRIWAVFVFNDSRINLDRQDTPLSG